MPQAVAAKEALGPRTKRRAYYECMISPREKPKKFTSETGAAEWEEARKALVGMNGTFVVTEDKYDAAGDFEGSTVLACLHMEVPQARETLQYFAETGEYVQRSPKKKGA